MWNPIKIEFENLFSHKKSSYDFKQNVCTVIFGKNDTDASLENNGAGKTTLFEAICIALTNESLRNLKKDAFINREEDECRISFELHNPVLKSRLKIIRKFFRGGKATKIEIWENDSINNQITSVNEANKRVLELIGIGREDLLKYFIISQDNRYTFFTASDGDKKEIMNRITSADMINPAVEELDLKFKELRARYGDLDREVDKLSDRKEVLEEQRREILNNDNVASSLNRIKDLKASLTEADEDIKENNSFIATCKKRIERFNKELSELSVGDSAKLRKERKKIQESLSNLESELSENRTMKRKLESELSGEVNCPKCSHDFIPESELKLSPKQIKKLIKEIDVEIGSNKMKADITEKDLKAITKAIRDIEESEEQVNDLKYNVKKQERKIQSYKEENERILNLKSKYINQIETLMNQKEDDSLLENVTSKINDCVKEIDAKTKELNPLNDEMEMIKFWQFNLGRSGFQTFLANKSIKIIEGITNSFLKKFKVDISVLINGFSILKSGEVREKIDIFVMNDGVTAEQFMSKSGGERGRVTLAGILGIQHLINLSSGGRGLNLILLDEVLPGIDTQGQERIISVLEKMGITIMMITQNVSENFNNENTLYVIKEDGVSRYV